jgi:hypothetical protein
VGCAPGECIRSEKELILLGCAIARQERLADSYVSEGNRGVWSSFNLKRAWRDGVKTRSIQVRTRTLTSIMEEYAFQSFWGSTSKAGIVSVWTRSVLRTLRSSCRSRQARVGWQTSTSFMRRDIADFG